MADDRFDDRLEADLRDALRLELASVRVGVAAPQVRGRIAARERTRRTTRLVLLAAAAVLAVAIAIPVLSGLVLSGPLASPAPTPAAPVVPGAGEPATVAAIDATTGDLVISRAWPDGRLEEAGRYAGAVQLLRASTGDAAASGLPEDAVAVAGPAGRLAIGLSTGDVLVFPGPDDGREPFATTAAPGATGESAWPYIGWDDDGRLVVVSLRGNVRLVEAATGDEVATVLPESVMPVLVRGGPQPLAWTGDGMMSAERHIPSEFRSEPGVVDLAADPPAFVPGLPASVRAATGLEPRRASDGSTPGTGCEDERPVSACAGLLPGSSAGSQDIDGWFVAEPADGVTDVVRAAGAGGLLVVVRATEADRSRLVVVDAPGSWQDAVGFAAPACKPQDLCPAHVAGVAPGGRSVAAWTPGGLVVGDLATGAVASLPAGTLFVGWPAAPVVATDTLTSIAPCEPPTDGDVAAITLSDAATSPSSAGALPVVGERDDADPWRADEMTGNGPLVVDPGGRLLLALPAGVCAEAGIVEALSPAGLPYAVPGELRSWTAGTGTQAGLIPIAAPESGGDWIVRARLWLTGADREAILLYRVTTTGPAKLVETPEPTAAP